MPHLGKCPDPRNPDLGGSTVSGYGLHVAISNTKEIHFDFNETVHNEVKSRS